VYFEYFGYIGKEYAFGQTCKKTLDRCRKGFYFDSLNRPFNRMTNIHSGGVTRILENCCRPYHGSVMGYKEQRSGGNHRIIPALGPSLGEINRKANRQMHLFLKFLDGLRDGFDIWVPTNWDKNDTGFNQRIDISRKILSDTLIHPNLEDAQAFLSILYEQNNGLNETQDLKGFSLRIFSPGNRSVWIPANLTRYGLDILNPIYNIFWINVKRLLKLPTFLHFN